jgi:hypothetical protein
LSLFLDFFVYFVGPALSFIRSSAATTIFGSAVSPDGSLLVQVGQTEGGILFGQNLTNYQGNGDFLLVAYATKNNSLLWYSVRGDSNANTYLSVDMRTTAGTQMIVAVGDSRRSGRAAQAVIHAFSTNGAFLYEVLLSGENSTATAVSFHSSSTPAVFFVAGYSNASVFEVCSCSLSLSLISLRIFFSLFS